MKKFYSTLVLAAAVALSASAAELKTVKTDLMKEHKLSFMTEFQQISAEAPVAMKAAPAVAKAKPTKVEEVYGYYTMYFTSYSQNFLSPLSLTVAPSQAADKVANQVSIAGWSPYTDFEAVFDPAKGTLTVLKDQVAIPASATQEGTTDVLLKSAVVKNWEATSFSEFFNYPDEPIVFYFREDGGFQVAAEEYGYAFWVPEGLYAAGVTMVALRLETPALEGWVDLGQATFTDGWYNPGIMCLGFEVANTLPAFDVKVQRNKENPYLFRLYDPYANYNTYFNANFALQQPMDCNYSLQPGCIEFDLTDPTCVLVKPEVYSGFDDGVFGLGMLFAYNSAGQYVYVDGPADDPEATMEDHITAWKDFVDSPSQLSVFDSASNTVIINDAELLFQNADFYTWNEFAERIVENYPASEVVDLVALMPISMTAVIQLPAGATGINNVITDNSNNTLEYFNLQGVRVNNPSNGIYIRRQGNDVQKVYVR